MKKKTPDEAPEVAHTPKGIEPLAIDFGRADLNEMAAKLNEVIAKQN